MKKKVIVCLLVCLFFVPNAWGWRHGDKIRVLDWNVYIGTDVFAILDGSISVDDAIDQFVDSNPIARMKTISKHIRFLNPHVIFLQEVYRVTILDSGYQITDVFDFLAVLEAELDNYKVAGVHELTSLTLPSSSGFASALDRDVIFVRKDMTVEPAENVGYKYLLSPPDAPITVHRGYTKVRTNIHGTPYLLINTHLEVLPPFREAQAAQLAAEIGILPDTVIIGGDFNDQPGTDTYNTMIAAGFSDRWNGRKFGRWDNGYTCCQDADLRNKYSLLDEQIDFVFTLNGKFKTISGRVIGDRWFNKTRTKPRLWPSDHGGLIFLLYNK
jgi:endonuclease/exonuclease/phosphatase family metal-dependent hydrolase